MLSVSFLLGVAAGLAFIQYTAHSFLFLRARPTHGQEEAELVAAMKSHRWDFAGRSRGYWDFYFGYGLLAILWGVVEILLLWWMSVLAATTPVAPLIAILLLANIGHAILTLRYFFPLPAVFDLLIAMVLIVALTR